MPTFERRTSHRPQSYLEPRTAGLNPALASEALADGLRYLKDQWNWNGSQIARVLHLSPTTINGWIRTKSVPVSAKNISPDVEAVIHLLAVQRNLAAMFSEPFHQLAWLETVHPDFGEVPLKKMSESMVGLIQVRQYLDYVRGRGA
jgi:hypothetical protein